MHKHSHHGPYKKPQNRLTSKRILLLFLAVFLLQVLAASPVHAALDLNFDKLFGEHGSVMLIIDVESGRILHANEAAEGFYGYTVEALQQMRIQDINQLSEGEINAEMALAAAQERNYFLFQHRLASGDIRQVEVYSYPYVQDGRNLLFSIVQDITPRMTAEQQARNRTILWLVSLVVAIMLLVVVILQMRRKRRERILHIAELFGQTSRYKALITASQTGVWEYNRKTNKMSCSPEYYALRGMKKEDLPDDREDNADEVVFDHIHPEDREAAKKTFEDYIAHPEEMYENMFRIRHQNGSWRWILSRGQTLVDHEGNLTDITVGTHIDMTELKEAREKAEAANLAKSVFLGNMTHELKTPLNGISGATMLLETTTLTEEQQEYAELMKLSSQNLLRIINDILDYVKLESDFLELEPKAVNLANLFDELNRTFTVLAKEKGIAYEQTVQPGLPSTVVADDFRLKQILTNLLSNGVKFTWEGSVALDVAFTLPPESNRVFMIFSVKDTGKGMTEEQIGHIYERFFKVEDESLPRHAGTGLGLPIAHQLANLMGGQLDAVSEPGQGSTFTFQCSFPLTEEVEEE